MKLAIILTLGLTSAYTTANAEPTVRIACVGDSITFGAGVKNRGVMNYPAQLERMLKEDGKLPNYEVKNFGVSARTMLNKGDHPYSKEKAFRNSIAYQPNIVIIKLGTNDSKPHNWKFSADYAQDTKSLIQSYQALESKPRIILCKPVVVAKDRWGITEKVTRGQVAKKIESVAFETRIETLDFHPVLLDKKELVPDGVHPNAEGATLMAKQVHRYLTTERDFDHKLKEALGNKVNASTSNFHGYTCYSFAHRGSSCRRQGQAMGMAGTLLGTSTSVRQSHARTRMARGFLRRCQPFWSSLSD